MGLWSREVDVRRRLDSPPLPDACCEDREGEGDSSMTMWGRRRVVVTVGDRDPEMLSAEGKELF